MKYADIVIDISLEKLDKTFQYSIPAEIEDRALPGTRVCVQFGKRKIKGIIVTVTDKPKIDPDRIRPLLSVSNESPSENDTLVSLAFYLSSHYGSTLNQALKTVFPARNHAAEKREKYVSLTSREAGEKELERLSSLPRPSMKRAELIKLLLAGKDSLPWSFIIKENGISSAVIRKLESDGIASVSDRRVYRDAIRDFGDGGKTHALNDEQRAVTETIKTDLSIGKRYTYLLYGVTGSGKTEVYMELISDCLKKGGDAIVLIPEIALTYQTVSRFKDRFGSLVSVINSRMSDGERKDQIDRAESGSCRVMIGPRSALFTPFQHLGLIIVDEEHESSYKSGISPRYHARDVAVERARLEGAYVVLGSATPSVESMKKALDGEYKMLTMSRRVMDRPLPRIFLSDMRKELRLGNRSIFSGRLSELINDRLEKKQQVILFLNRRGISGFVSCRSCGESIKCPHCSVSMTLHKDGLLHCHYCGHKEVVPRVCPRCGSPYIAGFRAGTEAVEEETKRIFPGARVIRMDADTTRGRDGYNNLIKKFLHHEADILVGTQMIIKGHDFPEVTLVGILAADLSLNSPDFRGAERTYQMITQAAGRAGRGETPGAVVIQTYQPDNYSIKAAAESDYMAFYKEEISFRRLMHYPPEGHLLHILITSADEEKAERKAADVARFISEKFKGTRVLGPDDDVIAKLKDEYRKSIYIKDNDYDVLIKISDETGIFVREDRGWSDAAIWFDFDPQ